MILILLCVWVIEMICIYYIYNLLIVFKHRNFTSQLNSCLILCIFASQGFSFMGSRVDRKPLASEDGYCVERINMY